ncbi:hypothetical protein SERLA73DRAFT_74177 [Serpula lacrymans var. lacrymans S7.3]|uniref:CCHC-type domain-containing protein n=2 Tax=Serpula lacrymans var. lacrymans TaxID=341189 RepID=F8Q0U8_SERL3|nr:uncharacterized protein SERLADRAFT_438822 [Serpula lacrymans var. lacrymans S7.9]EGN97926.1 hypothetical protein SERLA73DRAFT_74177 [Serpula lacrymans var. lacrymans S7.3]EGO23512.1 hypothetical protein SERLADRAFT_438822 [Serpula lacrymans var. lacrymans S7.9]
MSSQSQQPDVNTLLHNMRAQILALTTQLTELQAHPPAATPLVEKKFNKKVEVITDPGAFEGDRAQFAEWWIKLQIWVKANWDVFADGFGVPTAVLSRLKGPVAGNEYAVELLKRNVNPHIAEQLYLQDMRSENHSQAAEEVQKIGRAIELYKMHQDGGSTTKNNYSQRSPGSSNQNKNHSHGFQPFGLQPGRGAPMDIGAVQGGQTRRFTCYSCGQEGHMAQNCPNGVRAAQQKNNQGRQAHQLETEKPDDWLNTLAGRSYNKI